MGAAMETRPLGYAADNFVILRCVSWQTYESLLADDEERRVPRMTYDREALELVSPSVGHEIDGGAMSFLVDIVAAELDIPIRSVGSTTFRRADLERGFEADATFYIQSEELIRGKREVDLAVEPPPDLVLDMTETRSEIDKLEFFASFGIPEIWRCNGERVTIFVLEGYRHRASSSSLSLPALTCEDLTRFLYDSRTMRSPDWFRAVSNWAQERRAAST
jgi:Uma2 family endonuclease